MKRRKIVAVLVILAAAMAWGSYALAQKEAGRPVQIKPAAKAGHDVAAMREAIHLQREMMEEPLVAGQIAIMRIKDIALASKKADVGVKALLTIVTSTDHPAIKRSALMAAGELYEKSGNPTAAIKMMAEIVKLSDEPREREQDHAGREARHISRWLTEHPELAAKIIRHHVSRRRGAPHREQREAGLAEMDRRLDRRAAELKELAERLERRARELDRWAERLEGGRRDRPERRRREGDERRERGERRERAERRERDD